MQARKIKNIEKPERFSHMGEQLKQTYTIRIPAQVAACIADAAGSRGLTPTTLIQSVVMREFESRQSSEPEIDPVAATVVPARLETLRKSIEAIERNEVARFDQLRFEIVKTRSALLHSLDQTLSAATVDQIIEASERTAHQYTAGITQAPGSKS